MRTCSHSGHRNKLPLIHIQVINKAKYVEPGVLKVTSLFADVFAILHNAFVFMLIYSVFNGELSENRPAAKARGTEPSCTSGPNKPRVDTG